MPQSSNLTSFTEFTSVTLPLLANLNDIANSKPRFTSGVVSEVWDSLDAVISSTEQPIFSAINQSVNRVYKGAVSEITAPLNVSVQGVINDVQGTLDGIFDDILAKLQEFIDWVEQIWDNITGWFEDLIGTIVDALNNIYLWIQNIINSVGEWINEQVSGVIRSVRDYLTTVYNNIRQWIIDVYNNVSTWIANVVNGVGEWIRSTYDNIRDYIAGIVAHLQEAYEGARATIEEWIAKFIAWFEQAKANIMAWWGNLLSSISHFIDTEVQPRLASAIEGAKGIVGLAKTIWEMISNGNFQGAFDTLDKFMQGIGVPAPVKTLQAIISTIAYFWESVHLQFVSMEYNAQKQAQISLALEPLDLGSATQAVYKGLMTQEQFENNAKLAGISKDKSSVVVDANRPLPTPGQIQDSFLRGEINLPTHDKLLSEYGLSPSNIELIKELYLIIPGVSDLIRMAVREAFTPEIAEKFGQYQDFPQPFADFAAKQGLSADWSKRYWAAHWDLPSATMGFEMLHRNVITNDELKLLLRALDVMPFWREKLIQISYNPLTRVDVRRMYSLGILSEEQVKRAYLDLGYNEQKAEWLKQFTIRYYTPEDESAIDEFRTQAKTVYSQAYVKHIISESEYKVFLNNLKYHPDDIELLVQLDGFKILMADKLFDLDTYRKDWQKLLLSAYDRGLLHRNEITPLLIDLGYDDQEVNLELDLSDYNRTLSIRNLVAQQIHDQYVDYIIDNVGMHTLLDQFNFTSEEINRLQEEWDIERTLRTKRPSLTDLRKFFTQGLLTLEEFLDELRGEGYNERYISLYSQSLAKGA